MLKRMFLLLIYIQLISFLPAQEIYFEPETEEPVIKPPEDFFFGLTGGASLYSADGFAYGGGLTIGYGTGSALGLNITWFFSTNNIDTLEINIYMRFYLFGKDAYSGPYIQISGGPAIFYQNGFFHLPGYIGSLTGGIGFGWRFIIANRWFIEPFIRGGYPYLAGGGLIAGLRF